MSLGRSQPDLEGFLRALWFPPSSKLTPSLFQLDRMQDLPVNHFWVSGASWVNIINYIFLLHVLNKDVVLALSPKKDMIGGRIEFFNTKRFVL